MFLTSPGYSIISHDELILALQDMDSSYYFGSSGTISFRPSGDTNDYIEMYTSSNVPTIASQGTANLQLLTDSGTMVLGGVGNTNNENITINFESSANLGRINSTTGASVMMDVTLRSNDDIGLGFGADLYSYFVWETIGNDNLQLGTSVGNASYSGYISIMETADMGNANRSPSGTSSDPVLRGYSSDATQANDYWELYHDQTNTYFITGNGSLFLDPGNGTLNLRGVSNENNLAILDSSGNTLFKIVGRETEDQLLFGLNDNAGNQLIIMNDANVSTDYSKATQTNPTLYIQSDTTTVAQYGALYHDQTDFVIDTGTGNIKLLDPLEVTGTSLIEFSDANWKIYSGNGSPTTGELEMPTILIDGDLNISDTTPNLGFYDESATAGDENASILIAATDIGDGTEDIDVTFMQQVAGTPTNWLKADADGAITLNPTTVTAFSDKDIDDVGDIAVDSITSDAATVVTYNNGRVISPSGDNTIAAATGITAAMHQANGIIRIVGNSGNIDITANPQIADGTDGQIIILQGTHDTDTVQFDDGTGLALAGAVSFTMGDNDILCLSYDAGDDIWQEHYRSDN
ncbi:MAG: hypothetical protein ACFFG0_03440 [Candidatus Thorarchaeota archaeon]